MPLMFLMFGKIPNVAHPSSFTPNMYHELKSMRNRLQNGGCVRHVIPYMENKRVVFDSKKVSSRCFRSNIS